ncbi:MAG: hypothetical protein E5V49_17555 [Mesorhizobium sp.]|nr:hypothetical protein EN848_01610 [bacterium M00.F.Ca.ET.205.01.1.1]TGU54551.1 hypothetical protein EN795_06025 [bacterium M00.F.Ca.ET.152.01.1.1]TGV38667.1 hypothetical protein EN829_007055 [Mesorhizobium sp. M00.F.Ca.ET.186.01.1.1]TGZ44123.1 hypothetical protein EN805_06030 [bacterium M00.F.Ca.ET.162.01.1.1]TIW60624.1 MAG: hypothetical protein E5V48_12965 [Mesorhizobium sp.]
MAQAARHLIRFPSQSPAMPTPIQIRNAGSSSTFAIIAPFIGAAVAGVLAFRRPSSDGAPGPVFV